MSKAWERAMTVLDKDGEEIEIEVRNSDQRGSRCWRCRKNPSRVSGEDFSCEGCQLWMSGESDEDPAHPTPKDGRAAPEAVPTYFGAWGHYMARQETT